MSDTTTPVATTPVGAIPFEADPDEWVRAVSTQHRFWLLDNGFYAFEASDAASMDTIEAAGFSMYCLLTKVVTDTYAKGATTSTKSINTQLVKVDTTPLGRVVSPIEKQIPFGPEIRFGAWYSMPKIPWEMVAKLDKFFREVDAKHHTEAIVLLTWNDKLSTTENPSAGWGVLCPVQENTGAACDYKPDSIAGIKDPDSLVVGSVHSHPWMAAYASGTDHKDQADFPGLHITFGWQDKVDGGATQYHFEWNQGGVNWTLREDLVFEAAPPPETSYEEIEDWMKSVSKKVQAVHSTTSTTSTPRTGESSTPGYNGAYTYMEKHQKEKVKVPSEVPNLVKNVVVAIIENTADECPFCTEPVTNHDDAGRRCLLCNGYFMYEGETLENVRAHRVSAGRFNGEIEPGNPACTRPIYTWQQVKIIDDKNVQTLDQKVTLIHTPSEEKKD